MLFALQMAHKRGITGYRAGCLLYLRALNILNDELMLRHPTSHKLL